MRVTKVLICTEDDRWVECYAEGGMTTGTVWSDGTQLQNNKMPDTEAILIGMSACQVTLRATGKLVGAHD